MLVRLGAADSAPLAQGQRLVRARVVFQQPTRALPSGARPEAEPEPARFYEAAYVRDEQQAQAQLAQRACEAYRAAELIQPRPGLFLRVTA